MSDTMGIIRVLSDVSYVSNLRGMASLSFVHFMHFIDRTGTKRVQENHSPAYVIHLYKLHKIQRFDFDVWGIDVATASSLDEVN
jgi:hypothetical protein